MEISWFWTLASHNTVHPLFIRSTRHVLVLEWIFIDFIADAFNTTEKRTVSLPQTVTCSANSSQQCSYKWIHEGEEIQSLDNTLELVPGSLLGEYQCLAECQFHERLCVIQALLLTYAPSSNNWNANRKCFIQYAHVRYPSNDWVLLSSLYFT